MASRAVDQMVLDWVGLRAQGMNATQIAKLYATTPERVRIATNRVADADRAESGEDVSGHYWLGKS